MAESQKFNEQVSILVQEVGKLRQRHDLSGKVGKDYFEPGLMEYLDKSDGVYNELTGELMIRFESKGTRYNDRTEQIEKVQPGDTVLIQRDAANPYNSNNFLLLTSSGKDIGNMPMELCNAIAPLYDVGKLVFEAASVSFVEPISKRSRYAKQAILFVELRARLFV